MDFRILTKYYNKFLRDLDKKNFNLSLEYVKYVGWLFDEKNIELHRLYDSAGCYDKPKQVCEDKKVEDLKIPYYEKCFKSDMETFCYLYDGIIIPKKDLTLDWLKENCEPIGFDVDYFGSKPTRYSCVDYKVEVEE